MRSVIMLHGAWHQPAHFDDVAGRLRAQDVQVEVPDLAGHDLAGSTRLVQELVDGADEPPVLLAHSFGAVTATGVQGAAHLLFLAGFVFDAGESPQQWIERVGRETGRQAAPLPVTVDGEGMTRLDPAGAREGLFADCADDVAERAVGLLRPEPGTIFTAAPALAAWRSTPSTYVAGADDRAILPEMVAHFAQRCSTALTWPTSHSAYLSRPEEVAALVRQHL